MSVTMACLTGVSAYRMIESGQLVGKKLTSRKTPFGRSEPVFLIEDAPAPFYLMPRRRHGQAGANPRANLYALKDLGVQAVVEFSSAGAITRNLNIGQIVLPDDVIDFTRRRPTTFFENARLGVLRQFPVFCPTLRRGLQEVLEQMRLPYRGDGTVAATEGPRLETPAEVRMLATAGAEMVTHAIVPDVFLAKELQMCFAGACYLVDYAETGSRHRPFTTGGLFGEPAGVSQGRRAMEFLGEILPRLAEQLASAEKICRCDRTMEETIEAEGLDGDWHKWFGDGDG